MLLKDTPKVFKKSILQDTFRRLLFSVLKNFFATRSPMIPVLLHDLLNNLWWQLYPSGHVAATVKIFKLFIQIKKKNNTVK